MIMSGENKKTDLSIAWEKDIREKGFRITKPRKAVIDVLALSQHALDASQVFDLARKDCPSLGLVSVYRTLEMLESLDLIQRVHQPDGCHAYLAGFTGHQHLLICTGCGKTLFFAGEDMDNLFDRVTQESGYQINDHWLQLFGLCKKCKEKTGKRING